MLFICLLLQTECTTRIVRMTCRKSSPLPIQNSTAVLIGCQWCPHFLDSASVIQFDPSNNKAYYQILPAFSSNRYKIVTLLFVDIRGYISSLYSRFIWINNGKHFSWYICTPFYVAHPLC